jgi:molecular chaperone GrpE
LDNKTIPAEQAAETPIEDSKKPVEKRSTPHAEKPAAEAAKQPTDEKRAGKSKAAKAKKDEGVQELQKEVDRLTKELDQVNQELSDTKSIYQRMLAEYANYKRRTEQEKEQLGTFTKAETLKALLPAVDNLERAVSAPPGDDYKTGVDMTIQQLSELLTAQGLEAIEPEGETFDPELHNAVMREDADGIEPDTITQVYQKGYKVGARVLRPAMVKVAN